MPPSAPALVAQVTGPSLAEHIERICDSDRLRASPTLCSLLRSLAACVGNLAAPGGSTKQSTRARVQMMRLRKALADYYAQPSEEDSLLIELPARSQSLRVTRLNPRNPAEATRGLERPSLTVLVPACLSDRAECGEVAATLGHALMLELAGYHAIRAVGLVARSSASPLATAAIADVGEHAFALDIRIQPAAHGPAVSARLLDTPHGSQVWAKSWPFDGEAGDSLPLIARQLAAAVADETGAVSREILSDMAGRTPDRLAVYQATSAVWRYWLTGRDDDRTFALVSLDAAVAAHPASGAALAFRAAIHLEDYVWSETTALEPPARLLEMSERARSLSPANPWVELLHCYQLAFSGRPEETRGIVEQLRQLPRSGAFEGLLAGVMMFTADLDTTSAVYEASFRRTPLPPPFFRLLAGITRFAAGDLAGAQTHVSRVTTRSEPYSALLRLAIAVREEDRPAAESHAAEVLAIQPRFEGYGEIILRRFAPEHLVDPLAAATREYGLDWFQ